MSQISFADRGQIEKVEAANGVVWAAATRLGCLRASTSTRSFWLQMRGCSRIHSREGSFYLQRGDWICLGPGSSPELQSGRDGLTIGLVLPVNLEDPVPAFREKIPLAGRGRMCNSSLYLALRTWRDAARQAPLETTTKAFLLNVSYSQEEQFRQLSMCAGKTFRKKRERFEMLQNLLLYLDGNAHRMVRLCELATMASCSSWYISKSIRHVYKMTPRSIAQHYRLARARHLLTNTSLAVSEVSGATGFDSPAAFARAFRSRSGMTASEFRAVARRSTLAMNRLPSELSYFPLVEET